MQKLWSDNFSLILGFLSQKVTALLCYDKTAVFYKGRCPGLPDKSNDAILICPTSTLKKDKKSIISQMPFGSKVVDFKLMKNQLIVLTKDEVVILNADMISKYNNDELEKMYW